MLQKLAENPQVFAHTFSPNELKKSHAISEPVLFEGDKLKNPVNDSHIIVTDVREISDSFLCNYLRQRRINLTVANAFCKEISFSVNDKNYRAIGFKNNAGGHEIRNAFFKGSSSPKYVTHLDNNAEKITVFEGFFDFLSYQTLVQNQEQNLTNFLILNSLSFFERASY